MNAISRSIELEPRNEHFHFETTDDLDWHSNSAAKSIIFNALSIMFPSGEKFFMDSVKNVRDEIDDEVLLKQIKGFVAQEAIHTREHICYNKQLDAQGYRASELHSKLTNRLNWLRNHTGPYRQLAVTCALEHFTAMFADLLLKDEQFLSGASLEYRKVWMWHALEEAEHKGVAYDVLQVVTKGNGYLLRVRTMMITTIVFNLFIYRHIVAMLKDRGLSRSPKAWMQVFSFLFGKPGFFRRIFPSWIAYFKPGYHPWNHDNRKKIYEVEMKLLGRSSVFSSR